MIPPGRGSGPAGLGAFEGRWRLERRIDDHRAGQILRFRGEAEFTPSGAGMEYCETGALSMPDGKTLVATRRFLWSPHGAGIAVAFADGRFFHRFPLRTQTGEARHWCAPDDYTVRYDFSTWPVWSSRWRVQGPRKDYLMESRFAPMRPAT